MLSNFVVEYLSSPANESISSSITIRGLSGSIVLIVGTNSTNALKSSSSLILITIPFSSSIRFLTQSWIIPDLPHPGSP
jgi:short subunit fatty acids transporter